MNAKHLETLIKQGHHVAVKRNDGLWRVLMFITSRGLFMGTIVENTIEKCLEFGLWYDRYDNEDIEGYFTNEYKIVTPAPLMLEPGTKVEILENIRKYAENEGWEKQCIDMIGEKGFKAISTSAGDYVLAGNHYFPNWAVAALPPEEEVKKMTQKEVEKELGYKFEVIPNDED